MLDGFRIDASEQRNNFETQTIAQIGGFGIGAVRDIGLSAVREVLQYLVATQAKQRSDDAVVLRMHACQTTQASAAKEV